MEIRHLRYFLVVAEELHFNRAAERLHMQQPPLSRQIRQLEKEIGADLFERTTRSVRLTAAGAAFAQEAREILERVDKAPDVAVRAARGISGTLSVGFTGSNTYSLLPLVASRFREELPDAELRVEGEMLSPAQAEALVTGRLDACFGRLAFPMPELDTRVVWTEGLRVVLPATHRLAGEDAVRLEDLAGDPFVTYPSRYGSTMFDLTMRACQRAGFSPRIVQEVTQTSTLVSMVAGGFGVAIAPESVEHIRVSGAVYTEIADVELRSELVLAWRTDNDSPLLARFLAMVDEPSFRAALRSSSLG